VPWQVEVLARRLEPDSRILAREGVELPGEGKLGLDGRAHFAPESLAFLSRERVVRRGERVTSKHEARLVCDGLEMDRRGAGEAQVRQCLVAPVFGSLFHGR